MNLLHSNRTLALLLAGLGLAPFASAPTARAQGVAVGEIVGTNFDLQNRFLWTNNGQIYTPSNTTLRLHDFDGKIVFYCFFDVW